MSDSGGIMPDSGGIISDSGGIMSDSGGIMLDSGGIMSDDIRIWWYNQSASSSALSPVEKTTTIIAKNSVASTFQFFNKAVVVAISIYTLQ